MQWQWRSTPLLYKIAFCILLQCLYLCLSLRCIFLIPIPIFVSICLSYCSPCLVLSCLVFSLLFSLLYSYYLCVSSLHYIFAVECYYDIADNYMLLQEPLLLPWTNFHLSVDKWFHPFLCVEWTFLSISNFGIWKWISNFIPDFIIYVIIYPGRDGLIQGCKRGGPHAV